MEQGAHFVCNHHDPDYLKEIMAVSEGRGVDIILEMLANVNLGNDLKVLAQNGRVVIIGCRGMVEINSGRPWPGKQLYWDAHYESFG
jgi:NADPH2:quinone reductase